MTDYDVNECGFVKSMFRPYSKCSKGHKILAELILAYFGLNPDELYYLSWNH